MKKYLTCLTFMFVIFFLNTINVQAFSSSDYYNKDLCGTYEVAGFHADGVIDPVACYGTYEEAKQFMTENGADDLAIMTKVNGATRIVDANVALLDLSVSPQAITYFYRDANLSSDTYTYMDTGSLYGGVDGYLLQTVINSNGVWVGKVLTGGCSAWISYENYEIVPITWIKSSSSYTVTNESIRHNYVAKIQEEYYKSAGSTIGPKPDMLDVGTYYSFDGHYFYKDLTTMIKDYRSDTRANSVNNSNPYYNYYMFLSTHTKTSYSSANIDEYIRDNMGIKQDVYGNASNGSNSRLYGKGVFYYYAQEKYGVNAILSLSLSRNETGNGRSNLAINKNNGFGLNAVDSNPYYAANQYASYASSILGFASKWVTYGYARPYDWRYFGPQFGDKMNGMNVKYASDTYWSEKMAANYYSFDRAKGLQDYNYYQLGILNYNQDAYSGPTTNSRRLYNYPEAGDAVVIVGEEQGDNYNGSNIWYKVVSDLNIDSSYNEITSGDYNWNAYAYVPAAAITKINKGKNGYISPNEVTPYQDQTYTYDLLDAGNSINYKVGISTTKTSYYYDSLLQQATGSTLQKDRYVIVSAIAYNGKDPIAYLVSSDYKYDQKHWVDANAINLIVCDYAEISVNANGNQFTWVNTDTVETASTVIGGLYTHAFVPILETKVVDGDTWYKVPVSLTTNSNVYGWTLGSDPTIAFTMRKSTVANNPPEITATDKSIVQGTELDLLANVTATDKEDGDLTKSIKVTGTVDKDKVGTYEITYSVTDSKNVTVEKTITITVTENKKPVINATNKTITKGQDFDPLKDVTATDEEDGNLTSSIKVTGEVNKDLEGIYKITYSVTDSYNQTVTKEIEVTVVKNQLPVINAKDQEIYQGDTFDPKANVTATDAEDGDLTSAIEIVENTVDTTKIGEYKVIYKVVDSSKDEQIKEIKVTVVERKLKEVSGILYFDYLKKVNNKLQLRGYLTISGMNNTLDETINYKIIFENENGTTYEQKATRITDLTGINRPITKVDEYTYTHSWFTINIDIDSLPKGNYKMYAVAESTKTYSKALVTNKLYKTEITSYSTKKSVVNIKNNYANRTSAVTLYIRDSFPKKTVGSYFNQFDVWRTLEFTDNKLHIKGASYSYGMDLSPDKTVERKIIFENKETLKTYEYDLSSITNGLYKVVLPESDNLDKTRAWYDTTIDISNLEKGTYTIFITTKSNLTDISELTDNLRRDLSEKKATINDKNYQFKLNTSDGNKVELIVS